MKTKLFKIVFKCDENDAPLFIAADSYVGAVRKLYGMDDFVHLCDNSGGFDIRIIGEVLV